MKKSQGHPGYWQKNHSPLPQKHHFYGDFKRTWRTMPYHNYRIILL